MKVFNIFRCTDEANVLVRTCADEITAIKSAFHIAKTYDPHTGYGAYFYIELSHNYSIDKKSDITSEYTSTRLWSVWLDEKTNTVMMSKFE